MDAGPWEKEKVEKKLKSIYTTLRLLRDFSVCNTKVDILLSTFPQAVPELGHLENPGALVTVLGRDHGPRWSRGIPSGSLFMNTRSALPTGRPREALQRAQEMGCVPQ